MPKKKNKKFKSQAKPTISAPTANISASLVSNETADIQNTKIKEIENKDEITILNEKYAFVRHDVKKLLLTLGVLAVLFVGFYFLQSKTSILENVGNWIYKAGNIQIQ